MRKPVIAAACFLLLLAAPVSSVGVADPADLLPARVDGWAPGEADGRYDGGTLWDYIDGAAEVYRAFGVREVVARRYLSPHGADIVADLFDMGSPAAAYGAFHFDAREGEGAGIGRESELLGSSLAFWKDRYFVSVIPLEDSAAVREAVLAIGRSVALAIPGDGPPPRLAGILPPGGLVRGQVHYFRGSAILALLSPLGRGSALALHAGTEGILARYRAGGPTRPAVLLLVRYPEAREAARAAEALREAMGGVDGDGSGRAADGGWLAVRCEGELLLAATGAGSREEALALVRDAAQRNRETGGGRDGSLPLDR